ncbi:hypothetical protein D9Q98_007420 [Chlorella vulgaris]|uniref:MARVEL domain-containing protein n=1 Tax=Chlorella vulgaris TaxID=3077 RepID=A0A9D4TLB0_CHLVU|nr:hypothetical protein D9Q98_007420 [Chlorella vulgaris]
MGVENVKTGAFILRFFQMICAIVVFATIVDYDGWSKINYTMFVGITAFVLAFAFMVLYFVGAQMARGIVSLVIDVLYVIFWLAAAGVMSSIVAQDQADSKIKSSCAFSWISWFLWIGSAIISFKDWRSGSPGPSPTGPAPTGQIPSSSISMV